MTVQELADELSKANGQLEITVSIYHPQEDYYTTDVDVSSVRIGKNCVELECVD